MCVFAVAINTQMGPPRCHVQETRSLLRVSFKQGYMDSARKNGILKELQQFEQTQYLDPFAHLDCGLSVNSGCFQVCFYI